MEVFLLKYNLFYFLFAFLLIPLLLSDSFDSGINKVYDTGLCILGGVLGVYYLGSRDLTIGVDTLNYVRDFEIIDKLEYLRDANVVIRNGGDPIFTFFTFIISRFGDVRVYLYALALSFVIPIIYFIFRYTSSHRSIVLLAFMSVYSFKWMGFNTVRSGIALVIGLIALLFFERKKEFLKKLFLFGIAGLIHISVLLLFLADFLAKKISKMWILYAMLLLSSILAVLGYGINNLPIISEYISGLEKLESYIQGRNNYQTGFSFTYWLYNILIFTYSLYWHYKMEDKFYTHIFKIFIIISSLYFLWFNISFHDRIGVFSWILIPILITYPFVKFNVLKNFQYEVLVLVLILFQSMAIFLDR